MLPIITLIVILCHNLNFALSTHKKTTTKTTQSELLIHDSVLLSTLMFLVTYHTHNRWKNYYNSCTFLFINFCTITHSHLIPIYFHGEVDLVYWYMISSIGLDVPYFHCPLNVLLGLSGSVVMLLVQVMLQLVCVWVGSTLLLLIKLF